MIRSRILVLAVLCVLTNMLHAQTPDTQPRDERVVYDTLFVHDTLHVRDTINIGEYIRSQTFEQLFGDSEYTDIQSLPDSLKTKFKEAVTFSENLVLNNRDQNDLSMDSIKKIISAGLIVLGMSGVTPALVGQDVINSAKNSEYPKHEIGLSYGIAPYINGFYSGPFEDVVRDYNSIPEIFFGSINLQYHLYFNKLHSFDVNLSWSAIKHTEPDIYVRHYAYRNNYVHYLGIQAGYSIHFFNTEKISLYSSIYLGATLFLIGDGAYYEDGINHFTEVPNNYPLKNLRDLCFDFQINYLGIRIGKHNAANIELGYGSQGLLKIGYSYKF